jgi:transportin-1
MPACNNAAWALGELLMRAPPDAVAQQAERVSAALHFILSGGVRVTPGLRENAAITLGRVAAAAPAALAPHMGHFLAPWCAALQSVRDEVEKEDAFRGLCRLVVLNVEGAWQLFPQLAGGRAGCWSGCSGVLVAAADLVSTPLHIITHLFPSCQSHLQTPLSAAFASWQRIADAQLAQEMAGIMQSFKQAYGAQWGGLQQRMAEQRIDANKVLPRLSQLYGV